MEPYRVPRHRDLATCLHVRRPGKAARAFPARHHPPWRSPGLGGPKPKARGRRRRGRMWSSACRDPRRVLATLDAGDAVLAGRREFAASLSPAVQRHAGQALVIRGRPGVHVG
jgi:hypothetical protein